MYMCCAICLEVTLAPLFASCVWATRRQMAANLQDLPLAGRRDYHFLDEEDRLAWFIDSDARRMTYRGRVTEALLDDSADVIERAFYHRRMQILLPPLDYMMEVMTLRARPSRAMRAAEGGAHR